MIKGDCMIDKERITIDGVDVSKCKHYKINGKCRIPHYQQGIRYVSCNCDEWDCYYKQLARKTQECGQKEKEINELHLIIDRLLEASGYDKNISTVEDFEDVYTDIDYKLGLIDDLKQECEELKSESFTREELITIQEKDIDRYLKALEEIEEVCKCNFHTPTLEEKELADEILDIINKAKGERNE